MIQLTKQVINRRLKSRGIRMLSRYRGYEIKHKFRCPLRHIWFSLPSNVLKRSGCPKCFNARRKMSIEEKNKQLLKNQGFQLAKHETWDGSEVSRKYDFLCDEGHIWDAWMENIKRGASCPECRTIQRSKIVQKRINKKLKMRGIRLIESYKGIIRHKFKCRKGHIWRAWVNNVVGHGDGCPTCCLQNSYLTKKEVISRLEAKRVQLLSPYTRLSKKHKFQCENGHVWTRTLRIVLYSKVSGCPECNERFLLTRKEVRERLCHTGIKMLSSFKNTRSRGRFKCKNGHIWSTITWNVLNDPRCLICSPHKFGASEEAVRRIIERITGWKFPKAPPFKVPWLHGLHLDGYNKKHKIAFEYQGEQHYDYPNHFHKTKKAFLKQKRDDLRKRVQCLRHGITLICIPYWKQDIEGFIRKKLRKAGFTFSV